MAMKKAITKQTMSCTIREQLSESKQIELSCDIFCSGRQLLVRPRGYGEPSASDNEGWPIGIEIWEGKLRLIVFDDINNEDPKIIDMEGAKETNRIPKCNWCGEVIKGDSPIIYEGTSYCSGKCLDKDKANK